MIFCSKCGNGLENDMKFCNKCGAKVEKLDINKILNGEQKEITNQSVVEDNKNKINENQQTSNNTITITSYILLIIIATMIFYYGFMGFWFLVNGEFYIPVFLKIVIIGASIFYGLKSLVTDYTNDKYTKVFNISKEILKFVIGIIIIIAISIGINNWMQGVNEQKQGEKDKIVMLESLQKYSTSIMTVNDFDVDLIEKANTYTIYKVSVSKSDYLIDGDFYIALLMPNGNGIPEYSVINQDLSKLKQQINN